MAVLHGRRANNPSPHTYQASPAADDQRPSAPGTFIRPARKEPATAADPGFGTGGLRQEHLVELLAGIVRCPQRMDFPGQQRQRPARISRLFAGSRSDPISRCRAKNRGPAEFLQIAPAVSNGSQLD